MWYFVSLLTHVGLNVLVRYDFMFLYIPLALVLSLLYFLSVIDFVLPSWWNKRIYSAGREMTLANVTSQSYYVSEQWTVLSFHRHWTTMSHKQWTLLCSANAPNKSLSRTGARQSGNKGKGSTYSLPSVGFRSWSRFLAVSLQVTWVINPAVGCHYFPPGLQLPPQPLRGLLHNRGAMGVNSLPKTVTRQRGDCDLNPGPSAPESSTLTTRLPSHPVVR